MPKLSGVAITSAVLALGLAEAAGPSDAQRAALQDLGRRVQGFVVWESNRTGNWELYRTGTDGAGFKQLTHFKKLTQRPVYGSYLRPRVSPDGQSVLFAYCLGKGPVEVWLVPSAGGTARKLTAGNPLNWTADGAEILFVRNHQVWRYVMAGGKQSLVHPGRVPPSGSSGSMVGAMRADLKAGVFRTSKNEYFLFEQGKTVKTTGGCEPGFSTDGRYMYWVAGPKNFRVWDIAADKEQQLLGTPSAKRHNYTYFPSLSYDGRWLAFGASPSQHNHHTSDYEIFVQELKDWRPVGKPVRLSWHSRTDRWPYLYAGAPTALPATPALAAAASAEKLVLPTTPNPKPGPDALEVGGRWRMAWGNRAAVGEVAFGDKANVTQLLRLSCQGGAKDKVAVSRPVKLAPGVQGRVILDVFPVGQQASRVALAIFVSGKRVYYESVPRQAKPGAWTRLEFDLGASNWKCQATAWKHKATIAHRDDVRELVLLVYNGKRDSTLYVDNLNFN